MANIRTKRVTGVTMNKEGDFLKYANANCCSVAVARCKVRIWFYTDHHPGPPPTWLPGARLPLLSNLALSNLVLHDQVLLAYSQQMKGKHNLAHSS